MASFIPGYEYDIFISYRQKDNKYDCLVTEFTESALTLTNLKNENLRLKEISQESRTGNHCIIKS